MNRSICQLALVGVTAALFAGCADQGQQPTEARPPAPAVSFSQNAPLSYVIPPCPSTQDSAQKAIDQLLPQLFAPGNARRGRAQGYSNNMEKARSANNASLADAYADSLLNFALQQYYAGQLLNQNSDLAGTQQRLVSFITYTYCFNGYSPLPNFDLLLNALNSVLIRNGTPTTIVNDGPKNAGVKVDQGDVPAMVGGQPFFGTYVTIVKTTTPLPTSLDWYGIDGYKAGAFEFIADPAVTFTDPVLTGVCISYDDAIVTSPADLRLAHAVPAGYTSVVPGNYVITTAGGTIEVGAPVTTTPLGLACSPLPVAAGTALGRALQNFARLVLPGPLDALTKSGGTGSQVVKFSPFGAVDTKLSTTSTGPGSPQYIPVSSTQTTAPVSVTLTTRNSHTPVDGIPVTFTPGAIGSFSPSPATTGADGTAASTWTLLEGSNTGTATPQPPLLSVPASATFSVTAVQLTALSITTTSVPDGQVSVAYGPATLAATGGTGSYAWALAPASSLPAGMTLSAGGVIAGTPTTAGSALSFTVRVTSGPISADQAFTVNILAAPVTITTASPLPSATVGASYAQTLQASGGAGAGSYTWVLASGSSLPAGLSLSSAGIISGTPSAAGGSNFTVQVTSGTGATAVSTTKAFSLSALNPTGITLTFDPAPSKNSCYAVNVPITPGVVVRVTDQGGHPLSGVTVNMIAVTNNGSKVVVTPSSVVSSGGFAPFGGPTINKTGGYSLIISTSAPWPAATKTSGKFTISPSC